MDNVFVERLWRSVKYEDVYIKDYETVEDAVRNLKRYFEFYNRERRINRLVTRRRSRYTRRRSDARGSEESG